MMSSTVVRYVLNGLAATAVHYLVLVLNLEGMGMESAGLANLIAASCGITVSFLGSRYFVFPAAGNSLASQVARFSLLYAILALVHGAVLFVWTDKLGLDYRVGFLIATALQIAGSYSGNKLLVFIR